MIDNIMLEEIKSILSRISEYRNNTRLLEEHFIDVTSMSEKEIIDAILHTFFTENEIACYNDYMKYKAIQDSKALLNIMDSFVDISDRVNVLFDERKNDSTTIGVVNELMKKLKIKLFDVPKIRISSLHSHLEYDYQQYSKKAINSGMTSSKLNDKINTLEHRTFFLRQMTKKECERLKKELIEFKARSNSEILECKEKYTRTEEEYKELLKSVVFELLRDKDIFNAMLLSANDVYGLGFNVVLDKNNIPKISKDEAKEVSKTALLNYFFDYFYEYNGDKIDADTFCAVLEDFIFCFYKKYINKLETKKDRNLSTIKNLFKKHKEICSSLQGYNEGFGVLVDLTEDQEDTFALVYSSNK